MTDITGLAKCSARKPTDITDRELWSWLESRHPGLRTDLLQHRAPGERVHVPHDIETARERALRADDGEMSVRELAEVAGVGMETARRARIEKGRDIAPRPRIGVESATAARATSADMRPRPTGT